MNLKEFEINEICLSCLNKSFPLKPLKVEVRDFWFVCSPSFIYLTLIFNPYNAFFTVLLVHYCIVAIDLLTAVNTL